MTPKERAAMQQALEALEEMFHSNSTKVALEKYNTAHNALREALEVTEASISDHKSEQVMVSVDFMRHLEARFSYYGELVDGEWGNGRDIEELDAAHLLPKEVYQIRKILEEAPVFGFTQAHTSDKPLHHYALVLRDLDKTVDGWCEEPEFYLDGERLYAAPVKQAEQEPVGVFANVNALTPEKGARWEQMIDSAYDGVEYIHLYAAPVRTKDLTDDEAQKLWNDTSSIVPMWAHHLHFARAVIAADREKNNV